MVKIKNFDFFTLLYYRTYGRGNVKDKDSPEKDGG